MQYGVQMCCVHDVAKTNLEDAIRQVAAIGYQDSTFIKIPWTRVKGWLDEYGLIVCAFHAPFRKLFGQFEKTVADYEMIGVKEIFLPTFFRGPRKISTIWSHRSSVALNTSIRETKSK